MWRKYFALKKRQKTQDPPAPFSGVESRTFEICDRVFSNAFARPDQEILEMYFTSRWGDDLYAVEDYSLRHNIPTSVIWIVIRRANRLVVEALGILDKKDEQEGDRDGQL